MGLTNNTARYSKLLTIVNGKFTLRLHDDEDNPNAVERVLEKGPNAGNTVREVKYSRLEGTITKGELEKNDYGTSLMLTVDDGEESYRLQIPVDSQIFAQFAKRVPNLNPSEPVLLGLGTDRDTGRHFLFIKQNGESVPFAFTKDNPNGMPEPVVKTVKGEQKWDFEEQENFLYEVVVNFIDNLN